MKLEAPGRGQIKGLSILNRVAHLVSYHPL